MADRNVASTAASVATDAADTAAAAALVAADAVLAHCPEALWVKFGCGALEAVACARTAGASRAFRTAAEAAARQRVHQILGGTQLWADAETPGERPLLALNHLESLAHSPFVFAAARDLLRAVFRRTAPPRGRRESRYGAGRGSSGTGAISRFGEGAGGLGVTAAYFVEVTSGQDIPSAVAELLLGSDGGDRRTNVEAQLEVMLRCFKAQEGWASVVLDALASGDDEDVVIPIASCGSALGEMLLGVGQLLPATRAATAAQEGLPFRPARLFCQLLERLAFPPREAQLTLRFVCHRGSRNGGVAGVSGAMASASTAEAPDSNRADAQASTFERARCALETKATPRGEGSVEVVSLATRGGRRYVLLVERGGDEDAAVAAGSDADDAMDCDEAVA